VLGGVVGGLVVGLDGIVAEDNVSAGDVVVVEHDVARGRGGPTARVFHNVTLFPEDEDGWNMSLKFTGGRPNRNLATRDVYAPHLHHRPDTDLSKSTNGRHLPYAG